MPPHGIRLAIAGVLALGGHAATAQSVSPTVALVGAGATDAGTKQLVRTSKNVLYVVPFDCANGYPECGSNRVHVYQANAAGQPQSFSEPDLRHAPALDTVRSSAVAIDGNDVLHIVWITASVPARVYYDTFDTKTGKWGVKAPIRQTFWTDSTSTQGAQGVAIAVDATGKPHVVFSARATSTGPVRAYYTNKTGTGWSAPVAIDNQAVPTGQRYSYHPTLAFAPNGDLVTSWIQGSCSVVRDTTCYTPDGTIYTRVRTAAGAWQATQNIPDPTFASIDNGPSLLIGANGTRSITFTSALPGHEDEIRYWYDTGSGWRSDRQPAAQVTHDPVLGPDGAGGLYIYGHAAPVGDYAGYGPGKYVLHLGANDTSWGPWTLYQAGPYDDATSTRWSQFFDYFPNELDATFWTASTPYTLYVGTLPAYVSPLAATLSASTVPEMSTWVLFVGAFGVAGAALRRARWIAAA